MFRNLDPALHPQERAHEYVRALNAAKLDKVALLASLWNWECGRCTWFGIELLIIGVIGPNTRVLGLGFKEEL